MYLTISSVADLDAFLTALDTHLTTAGWTTSAISDTNYKGILAESSGTSSYDFAMGVAIYAHKYEDWNYIILQSAETFDGSSNLPDTNASDVAHLVYTRDATALTFTNVVGYIKADEDSIALVMGNTDEALYNAAFYGRLTTPSGDPADASNTTAVDVTAIALGSTSFALSNINKDGKIQVFQDLGGRYWQYYNVHDVKVANILSGLIGGPDARLTNIRFGNWQPYFKDLFLRDIHVRNDANVMLIMNDRDGLRGYIPSLFTMTPTPTTAKTNNSIIFNRDNLLLSGTGTTNSTATLLYDSANTLTGIAVGDVVRHLESGKFVKVTVAGSHLTTATVSPFTWLGAAYEIYSDISYSIFQVGFDIGEGIEYASVVDTLAVATNVASTFAAAEIAYVFGTGITDQMVHVVSSSYSAPNTTISVQEDLEADTLGNFLVHEDNAHALTEVIDGSAGAGALVLEGAAGVATDLAEDESIEILMSNAANGTYTMTANSTRATGTRVKVATVADGTADGYAALPANVRPIVYADDTNNRFYIDDDYTADYTNPLTFHVFGSTGNDAGSPYTIVSSALATSYPTVENIADATIDGYLAQTADLYAITAKSSGAGGTFTFGGVDVSGILLAGGKFVVGRSTVKENNGVYTVATSVFGGVDTVVTVVGGETVPAGVNEDGYATPIDTGGGQVPTGFAITQVDITNDVFRTAGDHSDWTGTFSVLGSTNNDAQWTVDTAAVLETRINVAAVADGTADGDIVLTTDLAAISIADTRADELVLAGNVASSYPNATTFMVFGSTGNDGSLVTTAASTYSATGWIYAWVDEALAAASTPGRVALTSDTLEIVAADTDNYGATIDLSVNNFTGYTNRNHPAARRRAIVLAE